MATSGCDDGPHPTTAVGGPPPGSTTPEPPTTWFAGPDPDDPAAGWAVQPGPYGGRYKDVSLSGWSSFAGVPNSLLGPDSLLLLPAARPPRKTFFEVYDDRLWLRQEGDTVHLNSYVIMPGGGSDSDSPYAVNVNTTLLPDPLKGTPVLTPGPANGSPVGHRIRIQLKDAGGAVSVPSETTTYPCYDPGSVFHYPIINGYQALQGVGKAYAVLYAVDGDGSVDRSVDRRPGGAVGVADRVDVGRGSAEDVALRSKVLTFYVNHAPLLRRDLAIFRPRPNQAFSSRSIQLNPIASDDDWLDLTVPNRPGGTPPNYGPILRWKFAVLGKLAGTERDTCYVEPLNFFSASSIVLNLPSYIANGDITIRIRVCDCLQCDATPSSPDCPFFAGREVAPQQGSCVEVDVPCRLLVPAPSAVAWSRR